MAEEKGTSKMIGPPGDIVIPDDAAIRQATQAYRDASSYQWPRTAGVRSDGPSTPIDPRRYTADLESARNYFARGFSSSIQPGISHEAAGTPSAQRAREKAYWDPTRSPTLWMIPFNIQTDPEQFKRLYQWTQFFYATHYLFPTLVDIYARFPLVGFEHQCKDPYIKKFFDHVFLDQMDYMGFLLDLNTEYWKTGETLPMADWSEELGCWVADELMSPIHVRVEVYPILGQRRFIFEPPTYLQEIATKGHPYTEYQILTQNLSDDIVKSIQAGHGFELSSDRITQLKRGPRWAPRGEPLLMRILRHLMIEEKLLRAFHSITERMITPLILAKLGDASVQTPDGMPWIPMQSDVNNLSRIIEEAMDSDYKVLATHFAVTIENVLGYEVMPKLGEEFAAIEEKMCLIFGISLDILKGGGGAPFASTALSADILSQNLAHNQHMLKKFLYDHRYTQVCEAHEFYDYNLKGGRREIIYERVQTVNANGEVVINEEPKLLLPDIHLASMNLRDEATQRQFLTELRGMGVPISDGALMVGVDYEFDDEVDKIKTELVGREIAKAETRIELENAFKEHGMPIDKEYIAKVVDERFGGETPDTFFKDQEAKPRSEIEPGPDMMKDKEMGGAPRTKARPDISDDMKGKETPEDIAGAPKPKGPPAGGGGKPGAPPGGAPPAGGGAPAPGAGAAGAGVLYDRDGNAIVRKTFEDQKAHRASPEYQGLSTIGALAAAANLSPEDVEAIEKKLAEIAKAEAEAEEAEVEVEEGGEDGGEQPD